MLLLLHFLRRIQSSMFVFVLLLIVLYSIGTSTERVYYLLPATASV